MHLQICHSMFMIKILNPEHASTIYTIVCSWCTSHTYIYKKLHSMFMIKILHPRTCIYLIWHSMFMMKMSHPEHASTIYAIVCLWCTSRTYIYKICISMFMMKISHPENASTIYIVDACSGCDISIMNILRNIS